MTCSRGGNASSAFLRVAWRSAAHCRCVTNSQSLVQVAESFRAAPGPSIRRKSFNHGLSPSCAHAGAMYTLCTRSQQSYDNVLSFVPLNSAAALEIQTF